MCPAAKYWLATFGGLAIFVIGLFGWMRSSPDNYPTMHWIWFATSFGGWAIYYYGAAWIGRCPACGEYLYRKEIFSDIDATCPSCGRDRYAVHAEGDRA